MSKKEKCEMELCKKKSGCGKFILGALVGAGLGVLFAPKAGSETRQELKEKMNKLVNKAKEIDMEDVKDKISITVDQIRDELNDLDREKVLKIAKEKGAAIKNKCEDLVEYVKEKGTPVLEKAANEVRLKTIDAVKEILEKLEATDKKAKNKK